jgi:hypothetical protein
MRCDQLSPRAADYTEYTDKNKNIQFGDVEAYSSRHSSLRVTLVLDVPTERRDGIHRSTRRRVEKSRLRTTARRQALAHHAYRRRDSARVLSKRLEKGRLAAPWEKKKQPLEWSTSELALFLEGSELVGRIALSPPAWMPDERRVVFT